MGKKYLITGVSGFVAGHYLEYLANNEPDAEVAGIDEWPPVLDFLKSDFKKKVAFSRLSLLDTGKLEELIRKTRSDYIIHLASYSSVAQSWVAPVACFTNNTNILLNIAEAVRKLHPETIILSIGSSEEYGIVEPGKIPLTEKSRLSPNSPYAVARVSQEMVSMLYSQSYGIPVICTRSFNHIGPRQSDVFVVSSFAKQIAEAKNGRRAKIACGDISVTRDFIDVRDVVRAYDLLLKKGSLGEAYNVCSGKGYQLKEIIGMLQEAAGTDIPVEKDPALIRPVENPIIVGSCDKLRKATGFTPEYGIQQSLADILRYWEMKKSS